MVRPHFETTTKWPQSGDPGTAVAKGNDEVVPLREKVGAGTHVGRL